MHFPVLPIKPASPQHTTMAVPQCPIAVHEPRHGKCQSIGGGGDCGLGLGREVAKAE